MIKQELLTKITKKVGFVAILKEDVSSDSIDLIKVKKYLMVETLNSDGTKGITNVTFIHNSETDEAWFYNVEPIVFDNQVKPVSQIIIDALNEYCLANFEAHFLIPERIDAINQWAVVEAYILEAGKLKQSKVMVYKKGDDPIAHIEII